MQEYFSSLAEGFLAGLPNFFITVLIFAVSYYVGVWLSRLLSRVLQRQNAEPGVSQLLTQIVKWTIISLGVISALQRFFNVTAFLTGLGIIGFTIGFALQNIMQNFVSGVILLVQRPFKAGDNVGIAGYDGTVLEIGLRTTEMKTLDGRIVFLPNADVLSQPIVNYTRAHLRRVDLPISISYDTDPEKVRAIILNEINDIPGYVTSPTPVVLFQTFGPSSLDLTLYFWVDTSISSNVAAKDAALARIKQAFERDDIEIPYPIQVQYQRTQNKMPAKRKTKK
jgi:small-conductance mechanosensitive channel